MREEREKSVSEKSWLLLRSFFFAITCIRQVKFILPHRQWRIQKILVGGFEA